VILDRFCRFSRLLRSLKRIWISVRSFQIDSTKGLRGIGVVVFALVGKIRETGGGCPMVTEVVEDFKVEVEAIMKPGTNIVRRTRFHRRNKRGIRSLIRRMVPLRLKLLLTTTLRSLSMILRGFRMEKTVVVLFLEILKKDLSSVQDVGRLGILLMVA
jgi:hypothetical protein